jgi:hypothetical protein
MPGDTNDLYQIILGTFETKTCNTDPKFCHIRLSISLSIRLSHVTTKKQLNKFSGNFMILEAFTKMCPHIPVLVKVEQK